MTMQKIMFSSQPILPQPQRGVATLLMSLVVLTTITFVLIYSARSTLLEQQMTANDLRGRQAFEAAEAGQEAAVSYLNTAGGRDKDVDGNIDQIFYTNHFLDPVDTGTDGVGDTDTAVLPNGATVTVTLTDVPGGPVVGTRVTATAVSDDGTAERTISQVYAYVSPLPNFPSNPLLTRGTIVVGGAAIVVNPEGHSSIWSGGPIDLSGNATTASYIADPSKTTADAGATPPTGAYPDCLGHRSLDGSGQCATMKSSDRNYIGMDIIEQDGNLGNLTADEFFFNFFGMTQAEYRQKVVKEEFLPADSEQTWPDGVDMAQNQIIWIEGGGTGGTETSWNGVSVGCSVEGSSNNAGVFCDGVIRPSIVIVNGDLRVAGNITFWGLLYVTGNISGAGSVDVVGAVMMQGTAGNLTGNLRVIYNSEVLRSTEDDGPLGSSGGSWIDY